MSEVTPPPPPPPAVPPTPPPPPGAAGPTPPKNWMGLVALITGIIGVVLSCCYGSGVLLSIAAIVLGLLGKKAVEAGEANNAPQAKWGFILGIIGAALAVVSWVLLALGAGLSAFSG